MKRIVTKPCLFPCVGFRKGLLLFLLSITVFANAFNLRIEAESGILSGDAQLQSGCKNASGDFVKLGNTVGSTLTMDSIQVEEAGSYNLTISYFSGSLLKLEVIVNDESLGPIEFAKAQWCYQAAAAKHNFSVELVSGTNKIEFTVWDNKEAPLIDLIQLDRAENIEGSIQAEDGIVSGEATIQDGCAMAVGGQYVELGSADGNRLIIDDFNVEEEGTYVLGIYYFNSSATPLDIIVNDESIGVVSLPQAALCYQGTATPFNVEVELNSGLNKIEFAVSNNSVAPILDFFTLKKVLGFPANTTVYVSTSDGDDSNEGLSPESPLKTLDMLSQCRFAEGAKILFKSGDTFVGQLALKGSGVEGNPITISRYGEGDLPKLDGANAAGGSYMATIYLNNVDHIEISDIEITNDRIVSRANQDKKLAYGIYVLNNGNETMRYFQFRRLVIRDVFALTTQGLDFNEIKVSAIGFKTTQNTTAGKEKNIRDVLIDSCYITRTTRFGVHNMHGGGADGIGNDSINRNMNFVIRNNHFYQLGGSCVVPGMTYNTLVENNIFDLPGSGADPRMANRGSGAWFWNTRNVISQYNKVYGVRGNGDSYGQHIDFMNKDVVIQYNYSEDSQGGFCEILGDSKNSTYRFNVSVNDGKRATKGNTIWLASYTGAGNKRVGSDNNYIYNNTVYISGGIHPDLSFEAKDTYIYNNIFYVADNAQMGATTALKMVNGATLDISNNLFYGNVNSKFTDLDDNAQFGNPGFANEGVLAELTEPSPVYDGDVEEHFLNYKIDMDSLAVDAGKSFAEPVFPMAGKGIFAHVTFDHDIFGNPIDIANEAPNIGADNSKSSGSSNLTFGTSYNQHQLLIYPNPVSSVINFDSPFTDGSFELMIMDLQGRVLQSETRLDVHLGIDINDNIRNGIYILKVRQNDKTYSNNFILYR